MRAVVVATLACDIKNCPTIYRTDHGTYLVQGNLITDPVVLAELDVPDNETLIEVPQELMDLHVEQQAAS